MASGEVNVVWLQAGACTGCSVSLLNAAHPSVTNLLIEQLLPGAHVSLRYHTTLMAGQGEAAFSILRALPERGFVLAMEGSLPLNEEFCSVGEASGREVSALREFLDLAPRAALILNVGTCAAFGGIPAALPNPGRYCPVEQVMEAHGIRVPFVNVPGCPPHPDWVVSTLLEYVTHGGNASAIPVDALRRPLLIYGKLIHENCPRRSYFDEGRFAQKPGDPECLHKVGCKGPITYADCPLREWNNHVNWCVKAGGPCQGCTQPEFIDQTTPIYVALAEDRLPKVGTQAAAGGAHE